MQNPHLNRLGSDPYNTRMDTPLLVWDWWCVVGWTNHSRSRYVAPLPSQNPTTCRQLMHRQHVWLKYSCCSRYCGCEAREKSLVTVFGIKHLRFTVVLILHWIFSAFQFFQYQILKRTDRQQLKSLEKRMKCWCVHTSKLHGTTERSTSYNQQSMGKTSVPDDDGD